jgi:beta-glucosidase-like glycosyl hydrolase/CubicO group peptidase (beta-lactamase class C family)
VSDRSHSFLKPVLKRLLSVFLFAIGVLPVARAGVPFETPEAARWADSVLATLSPAQRIAQMFMVSSWSNKDSVHIREIEKLIEDWGIGGVIFFQGGPLRQALLTNDYQRRSKVPLLIGIDGEWGLSMRLDSTVRFPRQMTLSAMRNDSLIYRMGQEIGRQLNRLGIHINFAPDADVNNNAANPVIGSRSFSDDPDLVARRAMLYLRALQASHILGNAKHFPGHGDVDADSHLTLPLLAKSRQALDSTELKPFRRLMADGLASVMVAHLSVPALDSTPALPSTLSRPIVTGLLQEQLGFKGLIFTDALNMKGVAACFRPGELELAAFQAGNDIFLCAEDVRKGVETILAAVNDSVIPQAEVDRRVRKILMAKYWCGLAQRPEVDTANLMQDLQSPEALALQFDLFSEAVTVLKNDRELLPLHGLDSLRIASVVVGDRKYNAFQQQVREYARADVYAEDKDAPVSQFDALFSFLKNYDLLLLSVHGTTMKAQAGYGIPEVARRFIDSVLVTYPTVLVDFGNAYTLTRFRRLDKAKAVVLAYEDFPFVHGLAAQVVFGGLKAGGGLPVNVSASMSRNTGLTTSGPLRLSFTVPERAGMDGHVLQRIDTIVADAIRARAMPGCQVLIARKGQVVFRKSYGYHTYDSLLAVRDDDLYDIASISKVAGTALMAMKVFDQGKLDLNQPLSRYLPRLRTTPKRNLTVREVMAHQAGFISWIPYWKRTVNAAGPDSLYYRRVPDNHYSIRVADSLYTFSEMADSILDWSAQSPAGERGKYVYSDLGPIFLRFALERITGKGMDEFLEEQFFGPLQLNHTVYRPWQNFSADRLVPTERDSAFRRKLLLGDVHDPAAAMMGGVSGNAGLFSNAGDLAVIFQMLLDHGRYAGRQYIKPNTVSIFTRRQFTQGSNRRGLLFDKPEFDPGKPNPCAASASPETFGHQGFTGTCVWADPKEELIVVFLSNRIYPDATNDKLVKMNVRTRIQQAAYDALLER